MAATFIEGDRNFFFFFWLVIQYFSTYFYHFYMYFEFITFIVCFKSKKSNIDSSHRLLIILLNFTCIGKLS